MGEKTGIGWTDATWNPWMGCTKVSPGCAHCYMFRDMAFRGRDPNTIARSKTRFDAPLKWKEPRRIFTCSWSDFFHEDADAWRGDAWDIIRRTPQHTYQVLTKRPERIIDHLPSDWPDGVHGGYPNVWLGTTVEHQRFDWRAAVLCTIPAAVRFVSAEPLLGRLDLTRVNPFRDTVTRDREGRRDDFLGIDVLQYPDNPPVFYQPTKRIGRIEWVIVGGESGKDDVRREMDLSWLERVVQDCMRAHVACYVKQDSGRRDSHKGRIPDHLWARKEFPLVEARVA